MSDVELSLRERKKAKLRAQILMTSLYLFQQRGYQGTRVADITDALEISQPTFFRYFPSKDAVLHEIFVTKIHRFREITHGAMQSENRLPLEKLLTIGAKVVGDWVQDHRELTAAFVESGALVQWISKDDGGKTSIILDALEEIFTYWRKNGLVDESIRPDEVAESTVGMVLHLIRMWLLHERGPYELRPRLESAARMIARGIEPHASAAS